VNSREPALTILQTNLMVEVRYHNGMKKKNMQRLKVISRKKQRNSLVFAPSFTKNYQYYWRRLDNDSKSNTSNLKN